MYTRATAALAALLLATLTACGTERPPDKPAAAADATSAATARPTYTFHDCVELLEYDYKAGTSKNAKHDPECAHLSEDEYVRAVGQVLAEHKDETMERVSRETIWDHAWDNLTPTGQRDTCTLLREEGVDAVAAALADRDAQPVGHETELAQYYLDNKC
jgi:predicted small lipoprotein YifL